MPVVAVIGAQWGDEGKGHIVDLLAERARLVIRYGGGNNAGHTVVNDRGAFKLHVVPSGIFDPSTVNVIGTTGRGVGPAYADKMSRTGIQLGDLLHEETLLSRLRQVLESKNKLLTAIYNLSPILLHETYLRYLAYGRKLADHVTDTYPIVQRALEKDVAILLEGAQGVLLDVDHGTYPYVTSSPPSAAGACQGAGIGPTSINSVVGVFKAYTTRVGEGPFPTEVDGDAADVLRHLRKPWAELGTSRGRLRRVGWFDAVLVRYAARLHGMDTLGITKLDVLDSLG